MLCCAVVGPVSCACDALIPADRTRRSLTNSRLRWRQAADRALQPEVHATTTWLDTAAGTMPSRRGRAEHSMVNWYLILLAFLCRIVSVPEELPQDRR